jgi:CHAT domain-containing protein
MNTNSITTTGDQTYNDAVNLQQDTTLIGNNLTFGSTVNGNANLTLNTTNNGITTFNGIVGGNTPLNQLTTNADGSTVFNTPSVTTTGNQSYNDNLTLRQAIQFTTPTTFTSSNISGKNTSINVNAGLINTGSVTTGGGNINFASPNGGITTGDLNTSGGDGGDITLTGTQITTDSVTTGGGDIDFTSTNGGITTGDLNTSGGDGGDITLTGTQITTNGATTGSGDIDFASTNGGITTGDLNTSGGEGGDITLKASQIQTGSVTTGGGDIDFASTSGDITTGDLDTSSSDGGDITLNSSARINIDNINSSGSQQGGNITLNAGNTATESNNRITRDDSKTIETGHIDSSGSQQAGDVTIKAQGEIQVDSIDASSTNGSGGTVNIETPTVFRAVGTIPDQAEVSISSTGPEGGDSITITYDGDRNNPQPPFTVGSLTQNGTVGAIQSSQVTITQEVFPFTTRRDNVAIISVDGNSSRPPLIPGCVINCTDNPSRNNNGDTVAFYQDQGKIQVKTIDEAREIILEIEKATAEKPALIYVGFSPMGYNPQDLNEDFQRRESTSAQEYIDQLGLDQSNLPLNVSPSPRPDDQLDILIITAKEKPVRVTVPITREQVVNTANDLWISISDPLDLTDSYRPYASQLYTWLITPLKEVLEEREITNLLFMMPSQLRLIPVSALYDSANQQYLVEKYSSGYAPSLNLNDNTYRDITRMNLLAMGASDFADPNVVPLPSVGLELPTIKKVWEGQVAQTNYQQYLNQNFTLDKLKNNLSQNPYGIIHLGTHGEFKPGEVSDSFIQLYNGRLGLNDIKGLELKQGDSPVELLVLSACETAFGDENVELGFVGLAVQSGVKSALGSLWQVSDTGTLALMTDFYSQLRQGVIKAEALRQAQLNMIQGKVYKTPQGSEIVTPNLNLSLTDLPPRSQQPEDFSHPFYWSPFTLIGSPW